MQLVQATRVKFTMSDDTTLSDLLSLNLHNFEDEVHGIVDKACKEMGMEKLLNDLEANWKDMKFDYEEHPSGAKLKCTKKKGGTCNQSICEANFAPTIIS